MRDGERRSGQLAQPLGRGCVGGDLGLREREGRMLDVGRREGCVWVECGVGGDLGRGGEAWEGYGEAL